VAREAIRSVRRSADVYLPHPGYAPWLNDFIEESVQFPERPSRRPGGRDDPGAASLVHGSSVATIVYRLDPLRISRIENAPKVLASAFGGVRAIE